MGTYLNPGNSGFIEIRNRTYVDKTGLIGLINDTIGTPEKLNCISRPRRFGKSYAAKMLCAYYDKTCESMALFDDLAIAVDEKWNGSYHQHLNRYDVIYLDMTNIMGEAGEEGIVAFIRSKVTEELTAAYPNLETDGSFSTTLIRTVELTGNKFVMIIDEWDAPIRETPDMQKEYLSFLRTLFKGSGTTDRIFAAAYMTGILPIKKDGSQSAISDFEEFPVIKPRYFGPYVGFTEAEVRRLCEEHHCDFAQMKHWYDGYSFRGVGSVYNPNSVMKAIRYEDFDSYWTQTSAAESLAGYVSLDFDGLSGTVAELIGGGRVPVDTNGFANDLVTFRNRDDVLTLLVHLGYLAYEEEAKTVRIPNEEIRMEFVKMIRQVKKSDTIRRVQESDQLILDTVHGREEAVAVQIERIHAEESPLHYNGEQALRSVVKRAYFSYGDEYVLFEEFPAGVGYADILYLPKKHSPLPALLVELKWSKPAEGAIAQMKSRNYPEAVKGYGGELLLVGIAYDRDAPAGERKHTCVIEPFHMERQE
ncbi:MAG: AAA family ATPase [Lachnospiraceae bacterium]|nr:AAA family ATPase [Lachnospiraceae bacterium]